MLQKQEYPPYFYLKQVATHYPRAVLTYIELWEKRDKKCKVTAYKDLINIQFTHSRAQFMNDLKKLVNEGLVSCEETDQTLKIELVDWQDVC